MGFPLIPKRVPDSSLCGVLGDPAVKPLGLHGHPVRVGAGALGEKCAVRVGFNDA